MKPVPIRSVDPTGRLDIVLIRLAEAGVRWGEQKVASKFGLLLNVWDGPDGLKHVLETKVQEMGLNEPMTPESLARHLGFIKSRKLKRAS